MYKSTFPQRLDYTPWTRQDVMRFVCLAGAARLRREQGAMVEEQQEDGAEEQEREQCGS